MRIVRLLAIGLSLTISSLALAQQSLDSYIELIRSDLQTQKKALITEAMVITDKEAEVFWPMYREYELEVAKLADARVANMKEYAANYEKMDDKKAESLIEKSFDLQSKRLDLKEKYFKKASKLIGLKRAAQWTQIEMQIQALVDAKFASEVPLLK